MAKAYECDGCNKFMQIPAKAKGEFRKNGRVFHLFLEARADSDNSRPDLCPACLSEAATKIVILDSGPSYNEEEF
jgi:hypothetical protein